jgi:phosphoribosylanthranilate isomerase
MAAVMNLFRIKICGITRPEDARLAAELGADAIGLNFVAGSPRCLSRVQAAKVVAGLPDSVVRIGVFAGASLDAMHTMADAAGLNAIQLHGELWPCEASTSGSGVPADPPGMCSELLPLPVIRAVHLGPPDGPNANRLAEANRWVEAARQCGAAPAMLLVDAAVTRETAAGARGGTGRTVDWAGLATAHADLPLALAGGLKPGNVATAVAASGAVAVDAASGVEQAPGLKDPEKLRRFISEADAALSRFA